MENFKLKNKSDGENYIGRMNDMNKDADSYIKGNFKRSWMAEETFEAYLSRRNEAITRHGRQESHSRGLVAADVLYQIG